jgi:hypothetical protein
VALSAIAASAAKLRKVERLLENLVERMDLILPAIGRLLCWVPPRGHARQGHCSGLCVPADATNSHYLRLLFSIR